MMSRPVIADGPTVRISLIDGYSKEQLVVNGDDNPKEWWQVFDRTSSEEIPTDQWEYDASTGMVEIRGTTPWHRYTVNFFSYRIWEEISMYNHVTNDWGSYEFTVSPAAIRHFRDKHDYNPCSEDFVNAGIYNNSYKVPSSFYQEWIEFINDFVTTFGKSASIASTNTKKRPLSFTMTTGSDSSLPPSDSALSISN